jgi:peptidoglycan-N-acetylglucosamine deacetylase
MAFIPTRRELLKGLSCSLLLTAAAPAQSPAPFKWPAGKRAAVSLSFDDARASQVDVGTALFDRFGAKATFYVVPSSVERRLEGWKKAAASGHEIGNHSLNHPCTGNFAWARQKALEDYTLEKMRHELAETNRRVKELLGVTPESFAYPCGQTFVGRGLDTRSYVPLVAALFQSGRGWLGEGPNDPAFCDLAQLLGVEMDGKDFEQLLPLIEQAREAGLWVVLAGHEIGQGGRQTTRTAMLEKLVPYALDPANGLWLAPVGTVARHVLAQRNGK